jgi:hypothetical protein
MFHTFPILVGQQYPYPTTQASTETGDQFLGGYNSQDIDSRRSESVDGTPSVAMFIYNSWILIILCLTFACIYCAWKAKRQSPLDDLPGPRPESFILGTNKSISELSVHMKTELRSSQVIYAS